MFEDYKNVIQLHNIHRVMLQRIMKVFKIKIKLKLNLNLCQNMNIHFENLYEISNKLSNWLCKINVSKKYSVE